MIEVRHNAEDHRFEAVVDGQLSRLDYRRIGDEPHLVHTEVPPALENRGIASQLVRAALDYAAAHSLRPVARCSYVRAYMQRHPETTGSGAGGEQPTG